MCYIKSPLNYTGNKYRILPQIEKYFPEKINCMIDLFCGGATVGLNTSADKVIFVDKNKQIIDLLIYLSKQNFEELLEKLEKLITEYNLSYSYKYGYKKYRNQCSSSNDNNGLKNYNSVGYYKLRDDYNSLKDKDSDAGNIMLYLLMVYAFNNDIRFNSNGDFNLPIGKTDLNKNNVDKLCNYIERANQIECRFLCSDFTSSAFKKLLSKVDFVYMDPPYLLGDAVYNSMWGNEEEYYLLDFIDMLIERKINFALSNILEKGNRKNEPLSYWCHLNSDKITLIDIDYNYKSASYNKKNRNAKEREILVVNKDYGSI